MKGTPRHRFSAAAYLASRTRLGVKFGLETPAALASALGHPERRYATLLVAGTNGKGSVVAYVDAALRGSSLRVGRYTSPHLVHVRERIVVGGRAIGPRAFEAAVATVHDAAERLLRAGTLAAHPTYFEVLTLAAFEHFRRAGVDVAVLEVGMGGRLDATNVSDPLVSAVVSVDRDHEAYLGTTLAQIAGEKAGVLRPGRPTVLGPLPAEARAAIEEAAVRLGARLVDASAGTTLRERDGRLEVSTPARRYRGLRPLEGAHQRENLVVALRLLEEAHAAGIKVAFDSLPAALNRTRWRGRLEWVPGRPPLLLDGAHNPAGARALAAYLRRLGPCVLLFGVMADKDVEEITRILFPLAQGIVLTRPPVERAASSSEIRRRAGGLGTAALCEDRPRKALALARRLAGPKRPVVVAGSLYLVGEVLGALSKVRK
jgi:dihydrofolate synthase/folylpolyglutamate synthase